jgi:predicted acyltransferase
MSDFKSTNRLLSLDVFRGLTIASMMLVNNPGSWDHVFTQLDHATWHGWTFTDFIFPAFLWIAGVAITLSFTVRIEHGAKRSQLLRHVLVRSLGLFAIGLLLNGFPYGLIEGHNFSWATLRIPGVLQRIAVCYFFASLIFLYSKVIWQIAWTVFSLVSYWLLIKFVSVPGFGTGILEPAGSLAWYIDSHLLQGHTYIAAPAAGFDPEGILSTLPAIATMLFGVLTGHLLNFKEKHISKTSWMLVIGGVLIILGLLMDHWLPINKNLWTSSYAVFTSGVALTVFACCYWVIDVKKYQKWSKPLQIYGLNALTVFVMSGVVGRLTKFIKVTDLSGQAITLKSYYYNNLFLPLGDPMLTSLLHAIAFMLLMYLVAYILYRIKLIIKI